MQKSVRTVAELSEVERERALEGFEQIWPFVEEGVSQVARARMQHVPLTY